MATSRFLILIVFLSGGLCAVGETPLPDPLRFQDGRVVTSPEDWRERRTEIVDLIHDIEYGHAPPRPAAVPTFHVLEETTVDEGRAIRRVGILRMHPVHGLPVPFQLYVPASAPNPSPIVIRLGIDEAMAPLFTRRGYAYACFEHRELDPDTSGHDIVGPAQAAYPEYDWASISVWAWGASRVLDYVSTRDDVDGGRAVITGHSRLGKTALLAGARDERFAIVAPNGSGCGGAGLFRDTPRKAETLELIASRKRFWSWFHADFDRFANREAELPFDQHFMRALVAPRVVLNTDALGDTWANPKGTARNFEEAQRVFDYLGVPENNICHFREGGHDQLPEDIAVLLDVADWKFHGKALTRDFSVRP